MHVPALLPTVSTGKGKGHRTTLKIAPLEGGFYRQSDGGVYWLGGGGENVKGEFLAVLIMNQNKISIHLSPLIISWNQNPRPTLKMAPLGGGFCRQLDGGV